ncbi:MAG TPA: AraC family transcriptional regulator [Flavobacterium sp.]|jgi:AraC-like DNA-binding protein
MFHFDKNFGLFIGKISDNRFHKHYALQISISTTLEMTLSIKEGRDIRGKSFFINSKVEHKLISSTDQLTILINPLCAIGHQLFLKFEKSKSYHLDDELAIKLVEVLKEFKNENITFQTLCNLVLKILEQYQCTCQLENHLQDDRIMKALEIIEANFEKVYSLEEIAGLCFLSPSRFLHLFKEKTGLNFRRYQLWNKVIKSLPYLQKNLIADTAVAFGFSDNSHYTRTFIETFGVTPKFFLSKH